MIKDANDMFRAGLLEADIAELTERVQAKQAAPGTSAGTDKEAATVPECRIKVVCLADVVEEEVSWLWKGIFAYKTMGSVIGPPGCGKTYLLCAVAAAVSTGGVLPIVDGDGGSALKFQEVKKGRCIYITGDDTASRIKKRIRETGGDLNNVFVVEGADVPPLDSPDLESMFSTYNPDVIFVDMLQHVVPCNVSMNNINEVAAAFKNIKVLAERYSTALIFAQHSTKFSSSNGGLSVHFSVGSVGINGIMRTVHVVGQLRDEAGKNTGVRGLAVSKSNIGRSDLPCLLYKIEDGRGLTWAGLDSDLTAEGLIYVPKPNHRPSDKREKAKAFIGEFLSRGQKPAEEVRAAAEEAGIGKNTYYRAVKEIGVEREYVEGVPFLRIEARQ